MQKHYFELDKVDSITLTMEKDAGYIWYDEIPARPRTFLGIRIGTVPAIPAGWNEYDESSEGDWAKSRRKQKSYFEQYSWYRVDEKTKKITQKPHIEIRFGYKQSLGMRHDSNEEAQAWIDELISTTDKKFHIIINK
jgi:hypothetical protein